MVRCSSRPTSCTRTATPGEPGPPSPGKPDQMVARKRPPEPRAQVPVNGWAGGQDVVFDEDPAAGEAEDRLHLGRVTVVLPGDHPAAGQPAAAVIAGHRRRGESQAGDRSDGRAAGDDDPRSTRAPAVVPDFAPP